MNPYFDFFNQGTEKEFYADFIDEEIRITGSEVLYIPKDIIAVDSILKEPYANLHERFYPMPMRLLDPMGYGGTSMSLGQFGIQWQAQAEWIISRRIFKQKKIPGRLIRPFEGDLIMIGNYQGTKDNPIWTNTFFEITLVQRDFPNWPLGQHYVWQISVEDYHHSYDKFNTGNPHIDRINIERSNEEEVSLGINKGLNEVLQTLVDFDEKNPLGNL